MAEIKIEKKKPIWPWVIVIFVILVAIYFFWYNNDRQMANDPLEKDTISTVEELFNVELLDTNSNVLYDGNYGTVRNEQTLADYFKFVEDPNNRASGNDYYRSSLTKLIAATERLSEIENVDVSNNLSAARSNIPENEATSESIEKAAKEVSTALKRIQETEFPNLSSEIQEVESAASAINGNQTLESEHNEIIEFFDRSAQILGKMHENRNQR